MKIKTKYDFSNTLFSLFLYINIFCKGIGLGNTSRIYLYFYAIGVFCVIYKITINKYHKREFIIISSLLLLSIISFMITRKTTLAISFICIAGMSDIEIESKTKNIAIIRLITFVSIVLLSITGIIDNKQLIVWRNGKYDTRYTLGYNKPNTMHLMLFLVFTSILIYTKTKKYFIT